MLNKIFSPTLFLTSNTDVGFLTPIPTFPLSVILNLSWLLVLICKSFGCKTVKYEILSFNNLHFWEGLVSVVEFPVIGI